MNIEQVYTADGSSTCYVHEIDEYYHSSHGAITESRHIFIDAGLRQVQKNPVNIFEIGYGTGLNALLSFQFAQEHEINIHYRGIEKFPLSNAITDSLNYADLLAFAGAKEILKEMHRVSWDQEHRLHQKFSFSKIHADATEYSFTDNWAHIVYFDAFAPDKQKELWSRDVFQKMLRMLRQGGSLLTYSAKGQLKRDLRACGFRVESLPGPPGKREITRAIKESKH